MVTRKEMHSIKGLQLLDLNDDCLEMIFKCLNIMEQFQISRLHTRFKNTIQSLWRTKLKSVTVYPDLLEDIDDQTFLDFMSEVSVFMQSLLIRHCNIRYFRLMNDQTFLQTQTFNWKGAPVRTMGGEMDPENGGIEPEHHFIDEDVNMLVHIFPNLRVLKLRACQITGKHLSKLTSLTQLSLVECQFLDSDNFRDVFQELKLRKFDIMEDCDEINCCDLIEIKNCLTLEHIKIADYHLCFDTDIINDMLRMPQLKKLSICSKNFVFDVLERISRSRLKQIEAFKYTGDLHNFDRFSQEMTHMKELKKLSLYHGRVFDVDGMRNHILNKLSEQLPNLEEIHFFDCDIESEEGVLNCIRNCPQLRLINLTATRFCFTASSIWKCMELIKKQKGRTVALELWLKDTGTNKSILEDPRYIYSNHLLKLDFKFPVKNSNPPGVLKFTFTT